jgi:UDP-N-acetyl-D-mannosaminuronic acid transferase (WecB/TagA/CpsF family)
MELALTYGARAWHHFRFVATEETLDRLVRGGERTAPEVHVVGRVTPPHRQFTAEEHQRFEAADRLNGTVRLAADWLQERGLHGAKRLSREPRRLWRRGDRLNTRALAALAVTETLQLRYGRHG